MSNCTDSLPEYGFSFLEIVMSKFSIHVYNNAKDPWFLLGEVCEYFECSPTKYKKAIIAISDEYIIDPNIIRKAGIVVYTAGGAVNTKATFISLDGLLVICASCNNDDARDMYRQIMKAKRLDLLDVIDELDHEYERGDKVRKELWQLKKSTEK